MLLNENFNCFQLFIPMLHPVMHAYVVHFNLGGNKVAAAASTSCIYYLYDDTILLSVLHLF